MVEKIFHNTKDKGVFLFKYDGKIAYTTYDFFVYEEERILKFFFKKK